MTNHKHAMPANPVSLATPAIVLGSSAAAGSAGTLIRSDSTIAAFDATSPTTQAFSDSPAVGSAAFAARRDHKHGMPADPGGGSNPNWYGNLYAAYGRCDPQQLLRMAQMSGTVAATPTNISTSVARIAYFRPPANITVNKIRYFGVGATTNVYRTAIYNGDTLARLTSELAFTTAAQTWGAAGSSLGLSLTADQLYFIAVSVNATGTTAGCLCMSATVGATTGQIGVLPKSWPGNLDIDSGYMDGAFAQGAVTTGALPTTFPTVAAQSTWTGGFPLFFLDNSNA